MSEKDEKPAMSSATARSSSSRRSLSHIQRLFLTFLRKNRETTFDARPSSAADGACESARLGWWPAAGRDQQLTDALLKGQFRLLDGGCGGDNEQFAYAAVLVGQFHVEILRWHVATGRWRRMPQRDGRQPGVNDWIVCWRPRHAEVANQAATGFEPWSVVAGERLADDEVALILATRRRCSVAKLFTFIHITDQGRAKQGFLMSPVPGEDLETNAAFLAYRRQEQELHLFTYDRQTVRWYRYRKRGRHVFWLTGAPQLLNLQCPPASDDLEDRRPLGRLYRVRVHDDSCHLVTGLHRNAFCLELHLSSCEWSVGSVDQLCPPDDYLLYRHAPAPLAHLHRLESTAGCSTFDLGRAGPPVLPGRLSYNVPSTLKQLAAETVLRGVHAKHLRNYETIAGTLTVDCFAADTLNYLLTNW